MCVMTSPNINTIPQADDTIILRGGIQMETALQALKATGRNPDIQADLAEAIDLANRSGKASEETGISVQNIWVRGPKSDGAGARRDVQESLAVAAEASDNADLAIAAQSLNAVLSGRDIKAK